MIVPISQGESYQIWQWARQRQAAKAPGARSNRFTRAKHDITVHFDGIKGEYAVAKAFLLKYDPKPLPGGDKHEPDLILPSGLTVSVKFREKPEYDFALSGTDPKELKADIAILTARATPNLLIDDVVIVGWLTRDEFLRQATITNYLGTPRGDRLKVGPESFHPIVDLLAQELEQRKAA